MRKWRYHSLLIRDLSIADAKLNAEGERGWELVSVCMMDAGTARAYFKQAILDEADTSAAVIQADTVLAGPTPFG